MGHTEKMTIDEYQAAVKSCVVACKLISAFDLPGMLTSIDRADSIGPLIDPTLWIKNSKAMREDREIIEAALPLWSLKEKLGQGP